MCNHYSSSGEWRDLVGEFSHLRLPVFHDRGRPNSVKEHVYPGRDGEILIVGDGQLVPVAAHWRYVPPFWTGSPKEWARPGKPGKVGGKGCNNARGETVESGRMFAAGARCLIPTDAFFEWGDGTKAPKLEHRFAAPDGRPFWLAGIWRLAHPEDGPLLTYTMITKVAGAETGGIGHQRQPFDLAPDRLADWLDGTMKIAPLAVQPSPAGTFTVVGG
jgi:putative SOS response-associated peptidase YedK